MGPRQNPWLWGGVVALLCIVGLGWYGIAWWQEDDAIYTIHVRSHAVSLEDLEQRMAERGAVVTNHWDNYRVIEITGKNFKERILLREDAFTTWKHKYGGK